MAFDGFDYMELAEAWCLYIPDNIYLFDNDFQYDYKWLQEFMRNFIKFDYMNKNKHSRFTKKVIKDIREFCRMLSTYDSYEKEVWKAISEMEDDYSMLRIFIPLIPFAWN